MIERAGVWETEKERGRLRASLGQAASKSDFG